ncbi:hypothetical protein ACHQM5_005385 [Ranunculus cassubicifolius]
MKFDLMENSLPVAKRPRLTNKSTIFNNWFLLPDDILDLIITRLTIIEDYIRFGAVCVSWHSIFRKNSYRLPRQLPVLVVVNEVKNTLNFRSTRRRFSLQLPENNRCVGCSQGWLVIEIGVGLVYLFNPFSSVKNRINLPVLTVAEDAESFKVTKLKICKVVLSASPLSNTDFVVLVIFDSPYDFNSRDVAFWRPGDCSWTEIDTRFVDDVIYYKKQFYAIGTNCKVFAFDISTSTPLVTEIKSFPGAIDYQPKKYLVESQGELLQVHRKECVDDESGRVTTGWFMVYKLNQVKRVWGREKNLGDCVLFVGCQSSMSVQTSPFPGSVSNYISFSRDDMPISYNGEKKLQDTGFYYFRDGTMKKFLPNKERAFWIEPKLYGC